MAEIIRLRKLLLLRRVPRYAVLFLATKLESPIVCPKLMGFCFQAAKITRNTIIGISITAENLAPKASPKERPDRTSRFREGLSKYLRSRNRKSVAKKAK